MHLDTHGVHSQSPRPRRARFALLGLAVALLGCSGGPTPDIVSPTATPPTDWFCEATGAEWDCVEEEDGKVVSRQPVVDLKQRPVGITDESEARQEAPVAMAAQEPTPEPRPPRREQRQSASEPLRSGTAQPQRPASGLASLHRNAGAETRQRAEPPTNAGNANLPDYRRLAYRPDREVPFTELPDEFYAVQLLALASPEAVERFVAEAGVPGLAAARVESDERLFYVLLLGIYRNRSDAMHAAESSPAALNHLTPWIRPLHTLKEAMLRADALAATKAVSN